jgi:nitrogen PTS system EIIA component
MPVNDTTIRFDLVLPQMIAANQKQIWRTAASEISKIIGIQERILGDRLIENEKQTVSAMGNGIAVPHLHLSSLTQPLNVLIRLRQGVDFKAPDNVPVDIICLLLTPEREGTAYLRTLARLSRMLRDPHFCHKVREAEDERILRSLFDLPSARMMAA